MRFGEPLWLWCLLLVPFLAVIFAWDQKKREQIFNTFVFEKLWKAVLPQFDRRARPRKNRFWLAGIAFLFLALSRPQWGKNEEVVPVTGLDILIALDVSNSMQVEDVVPSRIQKAKHLIRNLVGRLQGDRVGLIAFAASSYVACPLTTDLDYVLETLEGLGPAQVVNQGTDIGIGLDTARRALDRAAEEGRKDPSDPLSSRVLILISDGENHEAAALESSKKVRESGTKLFVLGVGTEKGGPIPVRDGAGVLHGYKKGRAGSAIVSVFKPDALMQVASSGGGRYWSVSAAEAEVDEILQDIGVLSRTDYAERRYVVYRERFQVPLFLALLFFLLELSVPARGVAQKSLILLLVLLPQLSFAASPSQPPLKAYLENEDGLKAFKKGDIEGAKQKFGSAQALDPLRSELQLNQGVVRLQEGNVEGAVQDFAGAVESARQQGRHELLGPSVFNLGAALAQKGDLNGAVRAYLEAIAAAKQTQDKALEGDARKNLELLEEVRQKQKQEQQNQKNKEGEGSQSKQDQNGEGGSDPKQKEKQQESKDYQDLSKNRKKKSFQSSKLSKEDAERVMAELSNRERELQGRLKKQKGNPQNALKDW